MDVDRVVTSQETDGGTVETGEGKPMNPVTGAVSKGDTGAAAGANGKRISIDPITRLEGHGKIDIFLDDAGRRGARLPADPRAARLRGVQHRPARGGHAADHQPHLRRVPDGAPHGRHQGAGRPLQGRADARGAGRSASWSTTPSRSRTTRCTSTSSAGRTSSWGRTRPAAKRNVVGVIEKVGVEVGKQVISMRRRVRELIAYFGGKVIHPVLGLPGGVSKGLTPADLPQVPGAGEGVGRSSRSSRCRCSRTSS